MKDFFTDPKNHVKFNMIMLVIWGLLFIPSLLFLKESIAWLVFMSVYANFVGHMSALMGSFAEHKADQESS